MLACAAALGFSTLSAEITASQPDRPILNITYQLAVGAAAAKDVFARLVIRLGAPHTVQRDELSSYASSPDHVGLYATWTTRDGIAIGLSLYGAPRATPTTFGQAIQTIPIASPNAACTRPGRSPGDGAKRTSPCGATPRAGAGTCRPAPLPSCWAAAALPS